MDQAEEFLKKYYHEDPILLMKAFYFLEYQNNPENNEIPVEN